MHIKLLALVAAGATTLAGCSRNPATGRNQLMLVSESQEIEMGQQYDQQVIQQIRQVADSNFTTPHVGVTSNSVDLTVVPAETTTSGP